jgi:hypothetical protein
MRECSQKASLLSSDRDIAIGLAKQLGHEDTLELLEAGVGGPSLSLVIHIYHRLPSPGWGGRMGG